MTVTNLPIQLIGGNEKPFGMVLSLYLRLRATKSAAVAKALFYEPVRDPLVRLRASKFTD